MVVWCELKAAGLQCYRAAAKIRVVVVIVLDMSLIERFNKATNTYLNWEYTNKDGDICMIGDRDAPRRAYYVASLKKLRVKFAPYRNRCKAFEKKVHTLLQKHAGHDDDDDDDDDEATKS